MNKNDDWFDEAFERIWKKYELRMILVPALLGTITALLINYILGR